eukprot:TRINITY_DN3584_c0_g1_i1.p1 TRINITY_DN3584_c0_g1~~TRINITY_DN3584_c0_g1_i1.p1  ORF type:complete len:923 (-),score=208.05 TRINITY_DN3584_c0_g1_i1:87-2855(-)
MSARPTPTFYVPIPEHIGRKRSSSEDNTQRILRVPLSPTSGSGSATNVSSPLMLKRNRPPSPNPRHSSFIALHPNSSPLSYITESSPSSSSSNLLPTTDFFQNSGGIALDPSLQVSLTKWTGFEKYSRVLLRHISGITIWKKAVVAIINNNFFIFRKVRSFLSHPPKAVHEITLRDCHASPFDLSWTLTGKTRGFELVNDGKSFVMCAETEEERADWIQILNKKRITKNSRSATEPEDLIACLYPTLLDSVGSSERIPPQLVLITPSLDSYVSYQDHLASYPLPSVRIEKGTAFDMPSVLSSSSDGRIAMVIQIEAFGLSAITIDYELCFRCNPLPLINKRILADFLGEVPEGCAFVQEIYEEEEEDGGSNGNLDDGLNVQQNQLVDYAICVNTTKNSLNLSLWSPLMAVRQHNLSCEPDEMITTVLMRNYDTPSNSLQMQRLSEEKEFYPDLVAHEVLMSWRRFLRPPLDSESLENHANEHRLTAAYFLSGDWKAVRQRNFREIIIRRALALSNFSTPRLSKQLSTSSPISLMSAPTSPSSSSSLSSPGITHSSSSVPTGTASSPTLNLILKRDGGSRTSNGGNNSYNLRSLFSSWQMKNIELFLRGDDGDELQLGAILSLLDVLHAESRDPVEEEWLNTLQLQSRNLLATHSFHKSMKLIVGRLGPTPLPPLTTSLLYRHEMIAFTETGHIYRGLYGLQRPVIVKDFSAGQPKEEIFHELGLRGLLSHPNLIECYAGGHTEIDKEPVISIVLELGIETLREWLDGCVNRGDAIEWITTIEYATNVACGLAYLHSFSITSGYIITNSLVRASSTDVEGLQRHVIKIADFDGKEFVKLSEKADLFGLGSVLWELATREPSPEKMFFSDSGHSRWKNSLPNSCPSAFTGVIKQCLDHEPARRPEASSIVTALKTMSKKLTSKR